jgi:hypothetical protein
MFFLGANFCTLVTRKNPVLTAQRFSLGNIHKSCHILREKKQLEVASFLDNEFQQVAKTRLQNISTVLSTDL